VDAFQSQFGLQFLHFVLDLQFLSFQLDDLEIACGWMKHFRLDLFLDGAMATLEFREMGLQRHPTAPWLVWICKFDTKMKAGKKIYGRAAVDIQV
jgi:hypothetical protein